jgi:hypothetical protein
MFFMHFDKSLKRKWATYYGGDDNEQGRGIATDNKGNLFIFWSFLKI